MHPRTLCSGQNGWSKYVSEYYCCNNRLMGGYEITECSLPRRSLPPSLPPSQSSPSIVDSHTVL